MRWFTEFQRAFGARRIARAAVVAAAASTVTAVAAAQVPTAPADTAKSYRSPSIILVQPAPERGIPADRPVVVFRFAQWEADDPVDATSLRVWVDGEDRSRSFQLANGEARGSLASRLTSGDSATTAGNPALVTPGVRLVVARLCSTRGVCGEARAPVTVLPAVDAAGALVRAATDSAKAIAVGPGAAVKKSIGKKILDALLGGVRKLLAP